MTNAERVKALRVCADCTDLQYGTGRERCTISLMRDAADAIEAADKRIAKLEAQLPKEGEWIEQELAPKNYRFCTRCGFANKRKSKWKYCPNCGARMMKGDK